jgi:hypothetical protein
MPFYDMPSMNGKQEEQNAEYQESYFDFPLINYGGERFINPDGRPWGGPIGRASFPWHFRNVRSPGVKPKTPVVDWQRRFQQQPMHTDLPAALVKDVVAIVSGNKPEDRSITGELPSDKPEENLNQPNYTATTIFTIEGIGQFINGLGQTFKSVISPKPQKKISKYKIVAQLKKLAIRMMAKHRIPATQKNINALVSLISTQWTKSKRNRIAFREAV